MADLPVPPGCRFHVPFSKASLTTVVLLVLLFAAEFLPAQVLGRATVLENARIHLGGGRVIEKGTLVIRAGRISQVGRSESIDAPLLSTTIDLGGADITPGMIDLESTLALDLAGKRSPSLVAWDGFDRYASHGIRETLASGVTAVVLVPGGAGEITGCASLVRLSRDSTGARGELIDGVVSVCVDLSGSAGPIASLRAFEKIKKSFKSAEDHRDRLEEYEEELEEYVETLEKQEGESKGDKDEKETLDSSVASPADADDEKSEELKKPKPPRRRPDLKPLLRALDHEIPVRVTAHRSDEILNALALAREFNLDLILAGATEAHLLIEEIKAQEATILLAPALAMLQPGGGPKRREHSSLARVLSENDIPWLFGSGGEDSRSSRVLYLEARRLTASSQGNDPLSLVTRSPARHLGISRRFGRISRGAEADLVIWTSDPGIDPAARVKRVLVGGKTVYRSRPSALREGRL